MSFVLQSWELWKAEQSPEPLDTPEFYQCEAQFGGETFQIRAVWMMEEYFGITFCRSYQPKVHYVLARLSDQNGVKTASPDLAVRPSIALSGQPFDEYTLLSQFSEAMKYGAWGRYFSIRKDFCLIQDESERGLVGWNCFFLADGRAELQRVNFDSPCVATAKFQLPSLDAIEVMNLVSEVEISAWISHQLEDETNELRKARDFAVLSPRAAKDFCLRWHHGDRDQYQNVVGWVLASQPQLWPSGKEAINVGAFQNFVERDAEPRLSWLYGGRGTYYSGEEADKAIRRLALIRDYFRPHIAPHLAKQLTGQFWLRYHHSIGIGCTHPTAHERIEAILSLREWAQDKFSPAEIEVLCS